MKKSNSKITKEWEKIFVEKISMICSSCIINNDKNKLSEVVIKITDSLLEDIDELLKLQKDKLMENIEKLDKYDLIDEDNEEEGCCWNESKKKWYEVESLGSGKGRCLGCYEKINL